MLVFSEIESGCVVASMSQGINTTNALEALDTMFPEQDGIECHAVPAVFSGSLRGFHVEKDGEVVIKIASDKYVAYEMSSEEIEAEKKRIAKEKFEKKFKCLPVKVSQHLKNVFEKHVFRYSNDEVGATIDSGEYFNRDFTVSGWWGSFLDAGGYANMNREIVQRLHRYGVIPITDIYPTITQVSKSVEAAIKDYSNLKPKSSAYPYVYAFTPMPHPPHSGKKVFFTMMETSTLHPDFAKYCNMYSDEVWVPSKANRQLFAEHGVKKPIRVMPLGIDELIYFDRNHDRNHIDLSKCKRLYGTDPKLHVGSYRFLTVIQWNIRKGYDALIKAFFRTFKKTDDVCLVIATQYATETVRTSLDRYVKDSDDAPQVLHCHGVIPINDMPYVYDACDCYVHLSRGEGFSLTQIEAAARGIPVISCYHSGMTEYMNYDNSFPVECYSDSPCFPELSAVSCYYSGQRMWHVGEEQIEQASSHMKTAFCNIEDAQKKARLMQNLVKRDFTWEMSTKRIAEALRI